MSENYAKLDQDIIYSTLWREDSDTCKLWITLLALKDSNGVVSKNLVGISVIAGIALEKCRGIVEKFCEPDLLSTSQEHEGRRLLKIAEGYWVVNHEKYRGTGSDEWKKEQGRLRVQRFREKHGLTRTGSTPPPSDKLPVTPPAAPDPKREEKADLEKAALAIYDAYPRKISRPDALRAIRKAMTKVDPADLLKKTLEYAAARQGEDDKFTPHPATWFNAERYNDKPETWKSSGPATNGKPPSIFELKTVLEAKQKSAQDLKNKFAAEGPLTTDWSNPEAKESYRVLRQEIKDLETTLAKRI